MQEKVDVKGKVSSHRSIHLLQFCERLTSQATLYWTLSHNGHGHSWEISLKRRQHSNGCAIAMSTPLNDVSRIKVLSSRDNKRVVTIL